MERPKGWTIAWLAWLGFLLLDVVAAVREKAKSGRIFTLSKHVWMWFPMGWQRSVLAAFLGAVFAHLVFEVSAWWLLTAVPVAAIIVNAIDLEEIMTDQTKALIYKYLTGAAVAALGGAVGALTTLLNTGPVPDYRVLGLAMLAGAGAALRLWVSKQASSLPSIFGITKSFGDKLAASPDEWDDTGGILRKVMLPNLDKTFTLEKRLGLAEIGAPAPDLVEIRQFSDERLQQAIEHVFQASGGRNGMFFNVNLNGDVRAGVAVKIGGHLSVGGFLEKKPGLKIEGLLEATYTF